MHVLSHSIRHLLHFLEILCNCKVCGRLALNLIHRDARSKFRQRQAAVDAVNLEDTLDRSKQFGQSRNE